MFEQDRARNLSMVMDFYELTMSNGYFADGVKDIRVAFDVFYRRNPDGGGFAIFAGLEQVADYVEHLHFTDEDIEFLRAQNMFSEDFLAYLRNFKSEGAVRAGARKSSG